MLVHSASDQTITCDSLDDLVEAADIVLSFCAENKVLLFYGEMGVGKTTFIKSICEKLHVVDNTSSPTFSIVNEYLTAKGDTLYHFDFYRLKNEMEAMDLGYEEYLYSGAYCFIEWPEKIMNLLPARAIEVHMEIKNHKRVLLMKSRTS